MRQYGGLRAALIETLGVENVLCTLLQSMKRPLAITIIGWLFIIAGVTGIIYHASEWSTIGIQQETIWALFVRVSAILGGIFTLKGSSVARWVLVIWVVYHVVLSYFHSTAELITHLVVTVLVLLGLFNSKANQYFRKGQYD